MKTKTVKFNINMFPIAIILTAIMVVLKAAGLTNVSWLSAILIGLSPVLFVWLVVVMGFMTGFLAFLFVAILSAIDDLLKE